MNAPRVKILIVDDYRENIEALAGLITSDEVEIHSTQQANEALELLTRHDFGLALLDVQMPGMSGFELARLIRGVNRFKHLPIIFVTAHQNDSDTVLQGYETGAVDLLFKPLIPQVVRSKVAVFVELQRQRALLQSHVQELERLRVEADAANVAKSQFLANMSHEIRTPLAAVMGFADILAKGQVDGAERDECAQSIRRNGNLLLRLIDDILDFSKIEANRLELERVSHCLKDLLQDIESTLAFRAREKGVGLSFHVPAETGRAHLMDPVRVKQVFFNIVGNALKFTARGEVVVDVALGRADDRHDRLRVTVRDTGIGMSEAQATKLFRPFGQADPSTKRRYGGSGLGLVISRQIARAMEGDLRLVSSRPEGGSVFEVTMLLERSDADPKAARPGAAPVAGDQTPDWSAKRILAVDDSRDNLVLIEMFLRATRANLTFAANGQEAVEAHRRENFDAILMDVQMPVMDGREAAEIIRQDGYGRPIIALTAHATRQEHERCLQSGCDEILVKPVSKTNLIAVIDRLITTGV